LRRGLGERLVLLDAAVAAARARGVDAYLVGGPVRDLLLGLPVGDLDVLLSHGLTDVARDVSDALGGTLRLHSRFLTASIARSELRLDLAQARSEIYPTPGALPVVAPTRVELDLARRDFAIHALALPLDAAAGGALLDPREGLRDLAARRIRILHPRSFEDDPTRLWRASRYAARLGFALEPATARAFERALAGRALDLLSGDRVRHEIERLLDERVPSRAAAHADRLGLLRAVAPGWRAGAAARAGLRRLARARARPPWSGAATPEVARAAGIRLLFADASVPSATRAVARLALSGRPGEDVVADRRRLPRLARALARPLRDGALDALLADAGAPLLLAAWCLTGSAAARRIERFTGELSRRPNPVRGERLAELGAQGPEIGALLRAARRRHLDGGTVSDAWLRAQLARLRVGG
jgi:tRNA nucleotidyltransferase (CCA-adding enzyme)